MPAATSRSSRSGARGAQSCRSARRADAASLLAPPSPAPAGTTFRTVTATPDGSPLRPSALHSAAAARHTRLSRSRGMDAARLRTVNGPGRAATVSVSASATDCRIVRTSW